MLYGRKLKFALNVLIPFIFIHIKNAALSYYLKKCKPAREPLFRTINTAADFIIMSLSFIGGVFVYRKLFIRDFKFINRNRMLCMLALSFALVLTFVKLRMHRLFFSEYRICLNARKRLIEYCEMFFEKIVMFPCLDELVFRKYLFGDIKGDKCFNNNVREKSVRNTTYVLLFALFNSVVYGLTYCAIFGFNYDNLFQFFSYGMCLCIVYDVTCFSVCLAVRMCYGVISAFGEVVFI
ncbi:hypothetical protein VCUG_02312 [Vavraia culicis subsp. floridensis]|uniref:Uncharacterized protein n=1 Tax=Vavraia culicis (isolate floridensis) TaxID=948595 RepID=L2GRB6_VAVCU|nr:uncharacterized protein VCUG_02312 [Vavraia culicis subsp. floridensis]ELA46201.1 hypothetical protein VCUG_02312 [Vavraia culicis subsp. floridensis]